jgi:hypothetical protein
VFTGLATLATAARRAADDVSTARPGRPAILPRDFIRSLGDVYHEFTGQEPGTGTGPFYRFVVQYRAALDPSYKSTDKSGKRLDESLVDAIKLPATAIALLRFCDIACSLSLAPLASFDRWRGGSTAGPSHYATSQADITAASPSAACAAAAAARTQCCGSLRALFPDPAVLPLKGRRRQSW